ncbi:MAG: ATP-binding protein [Actinoplanes sp.]
MTPRPPRRTRGIPAKQRIVAGFGVLLAMLVALTGAQLVLGNELQDRNTALAGQVSADRDANRAVLQFMTDAETAVRGFQLTGDTAFLGPYDSGRSGAADALDRLTASSTDTEVRRLLADERAAAEQWLYSYAIPIVNAGRADADAARLARGAARFDRLRTANADVDAAIDTQQLAVAEAAVHDTAHLDLIFAGLALLLLLAGLALAAAHRRHVLAPLDEVRRTLCRLRDGDLSARAVPAGPAEARVVAETLNDLAAQTERLVAADQARNAGADLREAVAAEMLVPRPPGETSRHVTTLLAEAFGASTAYGRVTIRHHDEFQNSWPDDAPPLPDEAVAAIRAAGPGTVFEPPGVPGALAVAISGDTGCPPGLICLVRPERPVWTEEERRVLEVVGRDVDHEVRRRRLEQRQTRLINELRVLDEQKKTFVSTVTHELRTPLTSILGYTEMLADGDSGELAPAQRRGIDAILRNAHRLEATVADLLVLDRSDRPVGVAATPVDLAALATSLHADLGAATRAKDLDSRLDAGPAWVRGVGPQLERALRNLLDNAIKFTPAGGSLEFRLAADESRVVVTVSDTGIGIPADDVPGLFTPFHRAANAMDQAVQGSGLGLAIVHTIVTEHGGTVAAHSELGRGSTFTMTLPAIPGSAGRTRSGPG